MKRIGSLYLAGPDAFFPDAVGLAERKRALCEAAGLEALQPLASDLIESEPSEAMAREIYAANMQLLRGSDGVIANLSPWRGPGADPGARMKRIGSLYLAGPDACYPDAQGLAERKRALCEAAGLEALQPLASDLIESEPSEAMAREIYANAMSLLRRADAVIANLTPWRGPGADPGTAFEAGVASGLGKPLFAYMNIPDAEQAEHRHRVLTWIGGRPDDDGRWVDADDCEIEDFGLPENLMLWAEARRLYVIVTPDPYEDLTGLDLCLDAVKLYAH